jgi:hypothetical protein
MRLVVVAPAAIGGSLSFATHVAEVIAGGDQTATEGSCPVGRAGAARRRPMLAGGPTPAYGTPWIR